MKDLFNYLKSDEIELIKSCIFHYKMEFIHPFLDGNGRMGHLWQAIILMKKYPVFQFIPFEAIISENQAHFYKAPADCDKARKSTQFIEYMLAIINDSLDNLLNFNKRDFNSKQRLTYLISLNKNNFTRKTYMNTFKDIISSTATRDLKKGITLKLISKTGKNNKTRYVLL